MTSRLSIALLRLKRKRPAITLWWSRASWARRTITSMLGRPRAAVNVCGRSASEDWKARRRSRSRSSPYSRQIDRRRKVALHAAHDGA
jgi:hypothetical protein